MDSSDDPGRTLHEQFLAGDPTAFAKIAEHYLAVLAERLSHAQPKVDPHLIETAVEDALLDYYSHAARFDPSQSRLESYLFMGASRDLLNALKPKKVDINRVELDRVTTEYEVEIPADNDVEREVMLRLAPILEQVRGLLSDPLDQQILELMMENVRDTSVYAHLLGIEDRPVGEQATIVKRRKDRIKVLLRRHLDPSELRDHE